MSEKDRVGSAHLDNIAIILGHRVGIALCTEFTIFVSSPFNSFPCPFKFRLFPFIFFEFLLKFPFISFHILSLSFQNPFASFQFPFAFCHFPSIAFQIPFISFHFPFKFPLSFPFEFLSFPSKLLSNSIRFLVFQLPFVSSPFLSISCCFLSTPFLSNSFHFLFQIPFHFISFPLISFQMIRVDLLGYRFWAFTISLYIVSSWFACIKSATHIKNCAQTDPFAGLSLSLLTPRALTFTV